MIFVNAGRPQRGGCHRLTLLAATTALTLLTAAPALAQSIVAGGAVDPPPPASGPWTAAEIAVGDGAAGTLTASGGATIEADTTVAGRGAGGVGTITLTGDGTRLTNAFGLYVGFGGQGELEILDGAAASAGSMVVLGSGEGSFGSLVVSGVGSRLDAGSDAASGPQLWIGEMFGAGEMAIELGGVVRTGVSYVDTGTVSVDGAGSRWEAAFLDLIDDDSSLTITNGGAVDAGSILIADTGSASISVDGAGSWLGSDGAVIMGAFEGSAGSLTLSGGASAEFGDYLSVGEQGSGTVVVRSGATLTSATGDIGYDGNAVGMATVTGAGSRWDSGGFVLGSFGSSAGTLVVADGGTASAGAGGFLLANEEDTSGTIVVGAASGEDAQAAGTVAGTEIRFGAGDGRLVFNHTGLPDGGDLRLAPVLTGAGTILHEHGTTYLDGDSSTFSGLTSVTGGRLMVMADLGGSVEVTGGGFLGGVSTIGSGAGSVVTIGDGGTLGPGDPVGILTIDGNLVFQTGSTFEVGLRSVLPSDAVSVTGTVDAEGGRVRVVALDAETSYADGGRHRILDTQGGFLSQFEGVDSESAFLTFLLDHSAHGLDLIVRTGDGAIDFSDAALTPNQRATASALNALSQSGPQLQLYNALAMLGEEGARRAFDQLSGEIHASAKAGIVDRDGQIRDLIARRLAGAFAGDGDALASAYWGGGGAVGEARAPIALWSSGLAHEGSLSGAGVGTLDHSGGAAVFGADIDAAGWRFGLVGSHGRSGMTGPAASLDVSTWQVGLYAGRELGRVTLRSGLLHGRHGIDSVRHVSFQGFDDRLAAVYDAYSTSAFGEIGYRLVEAPGMRVEPFAGLAHVALRTSGYAEEGGAAALSAAPQADGATLATLGVRARTDIVVEGRRIGVGGSIGWRRVLGDAGFATSHAFAGGEAFEIAGVPLARDAALVGLDLDMPFANGGTLTLGYRGQVAGSAAQHTFDAGFGLSF